MDPRYLIISPEDETGGRQRRFFSWLIWGVGLGALLVVLLLLGMFWPAAVLAVVALAVTLGVRLLGRRTPGSE